MDLRGICSKESYGKIKARLRMLNKGHANKKTQHCGFIDQWYLYANRRKNSSYIIMEIKQNIWSNILK